MTRHLLLIGGATDRMMERMTADFEITRLADQSDRAAFLAERGADFEAVATNGHAGVPAEVMDALTNLKIVSCYGVGYDAIDAPKAAARGIVVTHTPNVLNDEVANTAILLMLALYRNLLHEDAYVRDGRWVADGNSPLTHSPENRRVGILGMGRIGMRIAEKLQAFQADVRYNSRTEKDVPYTFVPDLVDLAQQVDVLICITPGGAGTRQLVNAQVLDALGPDGMLINVARGSVVDEAALVAALKEGRLGSAGLDVFEDEPHVPDDLLVMPNVILTPHVASATVETRRAMGDLVCDNLSQFLKDGTTLTPVPECAHL